jgi:XTP/dITP diphosphohydrolase
MLLPERFDYLTDAAGRQVPVTMPERVIVLGTHNRKKGVEMAELFSPLGFTLKTLADFNDALDIVEDGTTFAANAALKACRQASHLQQWVLGEDSGLAVDALEGRPGVYSARYSGPNATDDSNIDKLMQEMEGIPVHRRAARYTSHMTLANPQGTPLADVEACCHGRIANERRGTAGFGYDPVFEVVEYHMTFGELGDVVKGMLSHRGRAGRRIVLLITQLVRQGRWSCG